MAQSIIKTCLLFKSFTHNKLYTDMKKCEQFLLFLSPWAHALARWSTVLVVWTHLLIRNKTYKWIKQLLLPRRLTTANQRLKEQLTFTLVANICEGESCLTGECSNKHDHDTPWSRTKEKVSDLHSVTCPNHRPREKKLLHRAGGKLS